MSRDHTHFDAISSRLEHERARLAAATKEDEIRIRTVWVQQIEKELADERRLLGLKPDEQPDTVAPADEFSDPEIDSLSDDELLDRLFEGP